MSEQQNGVENVIIIGSGPAGWTAAVYTARANLKPLLFEGNQPGGQLTITTEVENYPGFPKGIMGPELMEQFKAQAERFETRVIPEHVSEVDLKQRPFKVVAGGKEYRANALIISSGASAKWLDVPGEQELMGRGVSGCATCDGFFFKNQHVVVIGGGDTAMEEANYLTKHASKVTVIHRRDHLRASKIMEERARKNPKIEWLWNTVVTEVVGEGGKVVGVKVKNLMTETQSLFHCTGVFVAIGHQPNTSYLGGQLETDPSGYVKVKPGTTKTNIRGVFACGDVMDSVYRQAITAAGTGCMAAIEAERFLSHGVHLTETEW
jgi:thioredoxin reductase (NADPH)